MRRVEPNATASERSAGPSTRSSSRSVVASATLDVLRPCQWFRREHRAHDGAERLRVPLDRPRAAAAAAGGRRQSTGAAARSAGESSTLRELMARPSASRTVGQTTTSSGSRGPAPSAARPPSAGRPSGRSRRRRRRRGRTAPRPRSRRPRSVPAARRPRAVSATAPTTTRVSKPGGYTSSTGGANDDVRPVRLADRQVPRLVTRVALEDPVSR